MWKTIKQFFSKRFTQTDDQRQMSTATSSFDHLMEDIEADRNDLSKLEIKMREEFDEIARDVASDCKGVDEVVR